MIAKEINGICTQRIHLGTADVGQDRTLSIPRLFLAFQEGGFQHSRMLGLGMMRLFKYNAAWVLGRQLAVIDRLPGLDETCVLQTWPSGRDSKCFYRDFRLLDAQGNTLVKARTAWFIVDLVKRISLDPNDFMTEGQVPIMTPVMEQKLGRIGRVSFKKNDSQSSSGLLLPNKVLYHQIHEKVNSMDIDFNGHVNNSRYVYLILGSLPFDFIKSHELSEIQVNYIKEALYLDELTVKSLENASPNASPNASQNVAQKTGPMNSAESCSTISFTHSINSKSASGDLIRARTIWKKRY